MKVGKDWLVYLQDTWRNSKGIDKIVEPLAPIAVCNKKQTKIWIRKNIVLI